MSTYPVISIQTGRIVGQALTEQDARDIPAAIEDGKRQAEEMAA